MRRPFRLCTAAIFMPVYLCAAISIWSYNSVRVCLAVRVWFRDDYSGSIRRCDLSPGFNEMLSRSDLSASFPVDEELLPSNWTLLRRPRPVCCPGRPSETDLAAAGFSAIGVREGKAGERVAEGYLWDQRGFLCHRQLSLHPERSEAVRIVY